MPSPHYPPSFRHHKHSEATKLKLSLIRRGKSWGQIFGERTADYLKALRSQTIKQRMATDSWFIPSHSGWKHSPEAKSKMRAANAKRKLQKSQAAENC
jgi:hypothetical protein